MEPTDRGLEGSRGPSSAPDELPPVVGRGLLGRVLRWTAGAAVVATAALRLDSARRRAEAAHAEAVRSTTTAQELVAAGTVGVLEGEGEEVLRANPAFLDMLGLDEGALARGLRWTTLTPPGYEAVDAALLADLHSVGRAGPEEKAYLHADGHHVHVLLSVVRLEEEPFRWVAFAADVSDRHRATERLVEQAETAFELARVVAGARSVPQLATVATGPISRLVGAHHCNVGVQRGEELWVYREWGEHDEPYVVVPPGTDRPLTEALATRSRVWVRTRDELRSRFPGLIDGAEAAGVGSLLVQPLWSSDHALLGALTIGWAEHPEVDPELEARLWLVAELIGTALERALLVERERQVSIELQLGLLGEHRSVPGLEVASRYLPAEQEVRVGGDLTDVVDLGDGRVAAVVGDIVGHGLAAAATMGQLRTAVRLLLRTTDGPAAVVDGLSPFLDDVEGAQFASLLVLVLDLPSGKLTYAGAGHPPAVLHDGVEPRLLLDAQNALLGVGGAAEQRCVALTAGSTVLLYSDGLVEDRRSPITEGIDRLARQVDRYRDLDVEALADELLVRMAPRRADDTALLVLRVPSP